MDQQHKDWIEEIRQSTWERSDYEDDTVPSTDALAPLAKILLDFGLVEPSWIKHS